MIKLLVGILLLLFASSISADSVVFANGQTLDDIKILISKESVEIVYKNGKREIKNKSEFKKSKIKFSPVAWYKNQSPNNEAALIENIPKDVTQRMLLLEKQREEKFAMSQKVVEERKRHDLLMKERLRLQYTEGFLSYAGGQSIYTEIMEKVGNRFYVRNQYGLLYFTANDFGEEIIIDTDKGKEKIDVSKMLAVKEEKFQEGNVYLVSGEKFKGSILKTLGELVVINTPKGEIRLAAKEILFPNLQVANNNKPKLDIKEGDSGSFLFENGEIIKGKIVKLSKNLLLIDTEYGNIEMKLNELDSFTKEEPKK